MEKIFVLGAGTMGAGIVQAFAQKGYQVIVRDIKDEFVERGIAGINKGLSKQVAKGKMTEETKEDILSRISGSVRQLMFYNGLLCVFGNATLADEMAQIVTIGPIIKEMVEDNVEGSEEDLYTLRLRNATFSDAMGVFGSQLIPWHVYIAFYM